MKSLRTLALVPLLVLAGCTFVEPTEKAVTVRVGTPEDVTTCKRLGQTNVTTMARIAGLPRHQSSIQDELNTLARNSAANMNGDTVVPVAPFNNGRQAFNIYRCRP